MICASPLMIRTCASVIFTRPARIDLISVPFKTMPALYVSSINILNEARIFFSNSFLRILDISFPPVSFFIKRTENQSSVHLYSHRLLLHLLLPRCGKLSSSFHRLKHNVVQNNGNNHLSYNSHELNLLRYFLILRINQNS